MAWVIWLTGYPGSGKTSIAKALCALLHTEYELLRLDEFRKKIVPSPQYTEDERDLMFIKDREGMGERAAFHKLHDKYEAALNKTRYFRSYDPRKA